MDTFTDIIDRLGHKRASELFGVPESHVRVMRVRDSIPLEYWPALMDVEPSLTFERLLELRRARYSSPAAIDLPAAATPPAS